MRRAAFAGMLLILSSLPWLRPAVELTRDAVAMARLPYAQRRAIANGPFWRSIAELQQRMPGNAPVPMLLRRPVDFDRALFLSYYLYPRVTRTFVSLDDYRGRTPAPPETPIAYIDVGRADAARVMTYMEIRAEQMADETFTLPPLTSAAARELIIPFATSFDGHPPDSYVTQAVFASESDGTLTLTLEPEGRTWTVPLRARQAFGSLDLIWDAYRQPLTGWIRAKATVPFRAGAWLLNRGRHRSAPIAIFTAPPPPPHRIAGGDKLWLLNADMRATNVVVNGAPMTLPPYALTSIPSAAMNEIDGNVLPFTSTKLADGNTRFVWP